MFVVVLHINEKKKPTTNWKQPTCPSGGKWMNQLCASLQGKTQQQKERTTDRNENIDEPQIHYSD